MTRGDSDGGRIAKLPPTRNHRQLATWINAQRLVDVAGREVCARVNTTTTSTDRKLAGTRLRHVGRGRRGLVLEIWLNGASLFDPSMHLYRHESSETYRRHDEARAWVEKNLRCSDEGKPGTRRAVGKKHE